MYLSSFVKSYEALHELVRCLLSLYDGTAKEKTSILIISGITSSGKSTLTTIIGNLKNWRIDGNRKTNLHPSMNRIPFADLRNYGNSGYISGTRLHLFEEDLVILSEPLNVTDSIGIIGKFHEAINTSITHRRIYHDICTITNPGVLLLEFNEDKANALPFLMYKTKSSKRAIKIISLPDKSLLTTTGSPLYDATNYSNFVEQCLNELDEIIDIRDIYKHYNKFCIFRQFHLFTEIMDHCVVDISIHIFSLLLGRSITNITKEWLKILLPVFNVKQ